MIVVFGGVLAGLALAAREGSRRRDDGKAAWGAAATELGGELGRNPQEGLRAVVGGVAVSAAVVESIGARRRHTRIWARARIRPGPRLALGTRRRRLSSIALDPATTAWTDRPRHVAGRWTAADSARWRRARTGRDGDDASCRVVSDGHTVELVVDDVVDDADRLVAAIELVGRLAADDLGALAALGELPGAVPIPGQLAVRIAPGDLIVEIDEPTSATTIRGTAELAAGAVRARSVEELARVRAGWATPAVGAAFAASGAAALHVALGESRLSWSRLELDLEKLRAGIAVIRAIAGTEGSTPYR